MGSSVHKQIKQWQRIEMMSRSSINLATEELRDHVRSRDSLEQIERVNHELGTDVTLLDCLQSGSGAYDQLRSSMLLATRRITELEAQRLPSGWSYLETHLGRHYIFQGGEAELVISKDFYTPRLMTAYLWRVEVWRGEDDSSFSIGSRLADLEEMHANLETAVPESILSEIKLQMLESWAQTLVEARSYEHEVDFFEAERPTA